MPVISFPVLSERLRKVLEELESIMQQVENAETSSNDNEQDFLTR